MTFIILCVILKIRIIHKSDCWQLCFHELIYINVFSKCLQHVKVQSTNRDLLLETYAKSLEIMKDKTQKIHTQS